MAQIRFDPKSAVVQEFFQRIGVPEESLEEGELTKEEGAENDVNLETLALLTGEDHYLSEEEAQKGLDLFTIQGERVAPLFSNHCSASYKTILGNLLGINAPATLPESFETVILETECPPTEQFTPQELSGIYYSEKMVPKNIRQFGQFVWRVENEEANGSSVKLDGKVLTANHMLHYKKTDVWVPDNRIENGELLQEQDVDETNKKYDLAILNTPRYQTPEGLRIAKNIPSENEPVWVIGFPSIDNRKSERVYTRGTITKINFAEQQMRLSAKAVRGFSGGAVINDQGELLGILTAGFCSRLPDEPKTEEECKTRTHASEAVFPTFFSSDLLFNDW